MLLLRCSSQAQCYEASLSGPRSVTVRWPKLLFPRGILGMGTQPKYVQLSTSHPKTYQQVPSP